jgi:hypothetical protein
MRSNNEYRQILQLWEAGHNKLAINVKQAYPAQRYAIASKNLAPKKNLKNI